MFSRICILLLTVFIHAYEFICAIYKIIIRLSFYRGRFFYDGFFMIVTRYKLTR